MDGLHNSRTDIKIMHFDTIILSGGIFGTMLLANFFGINPENIALYLLVGLIMSGYKLAKSKKYKREGILATILLGFFFSVIIAPTIEMKMQVHPLTTAAILGGLILLGEFGVYLAFERILGIKLEVDISEDASK